MRSALRMMSSIVFVRLGFALSSTYDGSMLIAVRLSSSVIKPLDSASAMSSRSSFDLVIRAISTALEVVISGNNSLG